MLPKIATPKYDMIVPSTGKSVTYRPYLIKEEKVLMMALESKDETEIENAILTIIGECFYENINTSKLALFDVEYMFLMLRSKSVGESVKLAPQCSSCDARAEASIDLSECSVIGNTKPDDLQVRLSNDLTVDIHYPRAGDSVDGERESDRIIATVAKCIDTIYYGEDVYSTADSTTTEVLDFVDNLNTQQFQKIADVLIEAPYVGHTIKFVCTECDTENERELKGLIDFFT